MGRGVLQYDKRSHRFQSTGSYLSPTFSHNSYHGPLANQSPCHVYKIKRRSGKASVHTTAATGTVTAFSSSEWNRITTIRYTWPAVRCGRSSYQETSPVHQRGGGQQPQGGTPYATNSSVGKDSAVLSVNSVEFGSHMYLSITTKGSKASQRYVFFFFLILIHPELGAFAVGVHHPGPLSLCNLLGFLYLLVYA